MSLPYYWPQMVVWETTLRCNMRCIHCGSTAGDGRDDELSTAEVLDVCRQLVDLNSERVILSGGETFLRHDWPQICEVLLEGRTIVGFVTNALVITDAIVDELARLARDFPGRKITICISLDGLPETHDYIRGVKGAYHKVMDRVARLRAAGIPFSFITTITKPNLAQLPQLAEIVRGLEPYAWQLQMLNGYGRARVRAELACTQAEYVEAVRSIAQLRRTWTRSFIAPSDCIGYFGSLEADLRDRPWRGCHAGLRGLGIQSNGGVKGCLSLIDDGFVEGNLRQRSLWEIWSQPGAFAYNREFTPGQLRGVCARCEHGSRCRAGCTAMAHSYTGSCFENRYCVTAAELEAAAAEAPGSVEGEPREALG